SSPESAPMQPCGCLETAIRTVRCILRAAQRPVPEVSGDLVALLVFKTSVGLNKVPGGFDSHPPPPTRTLRGSGVLEYWSLGFLRLPPLHYSITPFLPNHEPHPPATGESRLARA